MIGEMALLGAILFITVLALALAGTIFAGSFIIARLLFRLWLRMN